MDGSASYDPDGDTPLRFVWTLIEQPSNSLAELEEAGTSLPSLTPDQMGDYTVALQVIDSRAALSVPDQVVISTVNAAPVAAAGDDQALTQLFAPVTLDGSQSYDPDGDSLSYAWSFLLRPPGSNAALDDPSRVDPQFVPDLQGDYGISLTVIDLFGATSEPDEVRFSFENLAPMAEAGPGQAVDLGVAVVLDGSGSTDPNFDPLSYAWTLTDRPPDSFAALDNPNTVSPSFVADQEGSYTFTLVVNDGFLDSAPSSVTIVASTAQDLLTEAIGQILVTVNALSAEAFKNAKLQNSLSNKLIAVLKQIEQVALQGALNKLENDILLKTDGCETGGEGVPDNDDWLVDCDAQAQVYELILQAITLLEQRL